ncbi:MAG: hypothetical protein Q4A78_03095 [Peptostreptococcaceae bacterium]|nr:hypothetical protein [Peptostreptococcaceae bacterium]
MNKINVVYIPTHGTKEEWETVNPLVPEGALCCETDTGKIKVGDGKKRWRDIPYATGEPGAPGRAFRYEDFTEEQLNALKVKGDKGESAFELWQKQHPEGSIETFLSQLNVSIENAEKLGGRAASDYALLSGVETLVSDAERKMGQLADLQTEEKTSLVAAINELTKGPGILPGNVKNIRVQAQNGKLLLRWEDPEDVLLGGSKVTKWAGTKVVYKTGAHPVLETDGTLAIDSKVRNQYRNSALEITGLTNGTTYYIQIIPYSDKRQPNLNPENRTSATPSSFPPDNISELAVKPGIGSLTVTWSDPETSPPVTWDGTMIRYKAGSMIQNEHDGTLAVDSKVRDQYRENGFTIGGLSNGTRYFIKAFPYSADGSFNNSIENQISAIPKGYRTMGVEIDYNNSNPETAVQYIGDATSMTPKSSLWDAFFGHYPCLLLRGAEGAKLNPNDFTKTVDGRAADITSGAQGDVMICFPKRGIKIETVGRKLRVFVTDDPNSEGFSYLAHTAYERVHEKLYIGAYLNAAQDGCALSGKNFGQWAMTRDTMYATVLKGKYSNYSCLSFYAKTYLQCLFLLKYKHLNTHLATGAGTWDTAKEATLLSGICDKKGMDSVQRNQTAKILGIEHLFGNKGEIIEGCQLYQNYAYTATENFRSGASYKQQNPGWDFFMNGITEENQHISWKKLYGYVCEVQGTNELGFLPKKIGGSSETYFGDFCALINNPRSNLGCAPLSMNGLFSAHSVTAGTGFMRLTYLK